MGALGPVAASALSLLAGAASALAQDAPARDPRSVIVLREDCTSSLSRKELTLFANGTLRLRHGAPNELQMALHELDHAALDQFVARFEEIDLSEVSDDSGGVTGEWAERCVLELERPGRTPERFVYERYSTGNLALDRVRRLIEDLFDEMKKSLGSSEIQANYRPAIGDRLERADGELFEVVSFTLDGKGVELEGVKQPLTIFVAKDKVRELFVRIAPRP